MKKIGLALGGGGAKGLAHIVMLEVFDELGIRPHCIAGTSMGAIIGALYASGISAKEIRRSVEAMVTPRGAPFHQALSTFVKSEWIKLVDIEFGKNGVLRGNKFVDFLCETMHAKTFDELEIPLSVVASDFWTSEQVILNSGDLLPAINASMALPGVFASVEHDNRVLIDGGGVNPVPFDIINDCDCIVAIDVLGEMIEKDHANPNVFRTILGMFDIMQKSIVTEKLKKTPPEIYISPDILGIDLLEFDRYEEIYRQSERARADLKEKLEKLNKRFKFF